MTKITGENQRKNNREKHKDYSIDCAQNICTITYKGKIKERKFLRRVPFISFLGGTAVRIIGLITCIFAVIFFLTGIILTGDIYDYFLAEMGHIGDILMLTTGLLILCVFLASYNVGDSLLSSVKYVKATKCKKCGVEYAYEERKEPQIKEISTEDSYSITITRYWKCKYCDHIDSSESPENIKTRKGKFTTCAKIKCEKCGKEKNYCECRKPDIKEINWPRKTTTITTRYYMCEYCRHLNIEVEKEDYIYGEPPSISRKKGKDPRILIF